jgi:hypothetical protein
MPVLGGYSKEEDDEDEETYEISVITVPRADLPQKEWQVEIATSRSIKELKDKIFEEYQVEPDLQRVCTTSSPVDPGIKDNTRVSDLPGDRAHLDTKKVYLLPRKGKEEQLLARVLDWAYRAQELEDYEAAGCTYDPEEGVGAPVADGRRSGIRGSIAGLGAGLGGLLHSKNRGAKAMQSVVAEGDKVVMKDPEAPFVEKMPFNATFSFICLLNMIVVALEADYTCWGVEPCKPADRMSWYAMDCVFAMLFAIEISIRIASAGCLTFFLGDPIENKAGFHVINCIDFSIVFFRFLDTFGFEQAGIDTKIKIISCFRICQFARVAKLMRLVQGLKELWLIIAGLVDLCKTVMWVMVLLVILFWVFGIVTTIIIGHSEDFFDYSRSHWGKSAYFDTVPKSFFSLFQIMTLSNWSSILIRPVQQAYPAIFIIFIPFLCITTVGLLNIIVGVVVESTLNSAGTNAEKEAKETHKMHARVMQSLKMVFEEADTDGGGTLDKDELKKSLKKPHVRDRLRVLDIPIKDLYQLFDVLDEEGVGEIRTDQFFRGCSRLRGVALACDLHRMSVDFSRYIQWSDDLVKSTKGTNATLSSLLHDMESVDRDIIRGESDEFDPILGCRRDRSLKRDIAWKQDNQATNTNNLRADTKNTKASNSTSRKSTKRASLLSRTLTGAMTDMGFEPNLPAGHQDPSTHQKRSSSKERSRSK